MWYTHLGIGHPTLLRRIARDCFGPQLASQTDAMGVVNDKDDANSEDGNNGNCSEGCADLGDNDDDDKGFEGFGEDGEDGDEGCKYGSSLSDEEQYELDDGDEFEFSF